MTNIAAVTDSSLSALISAKATQQLAAHQAETQHSLDWLVDKGVTFAVGLIPTVIILVVGVIAIRLLDLTIRKALEKSGKRDTLFGHFIRGVATKVCWTVLIVTAISCLGIEIAPIIAGLGVTGFILGFAFQESLGNLASGLMIAVNEPFKIGDYVVVAGHEGRVLNVDMMATVLATADNKKVIIPNKSAWGGPIVNFTALGRRRVDLAIGIDYSSDVAKAIKVALETLSTVPNVLAEPAPAVFVKSLDDSQVTLNIRPWANGTDYWKVCSDTQIAIKSAFEKNGIGIPFPQLTIHQV